MKVVYTNISVNYCPGWTILEALRELIQEGLDVQICFKCNVEFRYEDNCFIIEDDGPGLKFSALALGMSGKKDNAEAIGQFGEGLKLACMVFARDGYSLEIETVGFTLVPTIVQHPDLLCDVLAFTLKPNERKVGTAIRAVASKEEVDEACSLFLRFCRDGYYIPSITKSPKEITEKDSIFLPGGQVYVCGLRVSYKSSFNDTTYFSYNVFNKELVNRDRWAVSLDKLCEAIREVWSRCEDYRLIKEFIQLLADRKHEFIEVSWGLMPPVHTLTAPKLWKRAVREVFIYNKIIIDNTYDRGATTYLESSGYKVFTHPYYRVTSLLRHFGVKSTSDVLNELGRFEEVPVEKLPNIEAFNVTLATELLSRVFKKMPPVKCARFHQEDTLGCYQREDKTIYLSVHILSDLQRTLQTLVHEYAHSLCDAQDCTTAFQEALERLVVDLLFCISLNEKIEVA